MIIARVIFIYPRIRFNFTGKIWLEKQIEEAEGGDYFTLINQALRQYQEKQEKTTVKKNLEIKI